MRTPIGRDGVIAFGYEDKEQGDMLFLQQGGERVEAFEVGRPERAVIVGGGRTEGGCGGGDIEAIFNIAQQGIGR